MGSFRLPARWKQAKSGSTQYQPPVSLLQVAQFGAGCRLPEYMSTARGIERQGRYRIWIAAGARGTTLKRRPESTAELRDCSSRAHCSQDYRRDTAKDRETYLYDVFVAISAGSSSRRS